MVDLRGFEYVENTGVPVSGATVRVYEAVLTGAYGAAVGTTTTNPDGMWEFTGLPDGVFYDVKLEYNGQIQYYKGESKVNVRHVADDESPDTNQNLIPNGGMTGWSAWVRAGSSAVHPLTSNSELADHWAATVSGGDSATGTRATPTGLNARYVSSIAYTRVGGNLQYSVTYPVEYAYALRSQTVTVTIHVKQGTNARLKAFINDGVGETAGTVYTGTGSYSAITVTRTLDAAATALVIGIKTDTPASGVYAIEVGNAVGDYGAIAPTFVVDRSDRGLSVAESDRRRGLDVVSDVATALSTDTAYLSEIINMLARQTRLVTGGAGWKTAPTATLASLLASVGTLTTDVAARVLKSGDSMTGNLSIANNFGLRVSDTAVNPRMLVTIATDDRVYIGHTGFPILLQGNSLKFKTASAETDISLATHNHSGVYSDASHNHSGVYSDASHNHAALYSALAHNHSGVYDVVGHTHSNPSGMAKIYSGSYTGNGAASQSINTGITPKIVYLSNQAIGGNQLLLVDTVNGTLFPVGGAIAKNYTCSISGTNVSVTLSSGMNTSPDTYNIVVLGT